jgi:hypothetical protein
MFGTVGGRNAQKLILGGLDRAKKSLIESVTFTVIDFVHGSHGARRTSGSDGHLEISPQVSGTDDHFLDLWGKGEYDQTVQTYSSFWSERRLVAVSRTIWI